MNGTINWPKLFAKYINNMLDNKHGYTMHNAKKLFKEHYNEFLSVYEEYNMLYQYMKLIIAQKLAIDTIKIITSDSNIPDFTAEEQLVLQKAYNLYINDKDVYNELVNAITDRLQYDPEFDAWRIHTPMTYENRLKIQELIDEFKFDKE